MECVAMRNKATQLILLLVSLAISEFHQIGFAEEINLVYDSLDTKKLGEDKPILSETVKTTLDKITVRIISSSQGSGTIFYNSEKGTCTVLTAWHNIKNLSDDEEIEIITSDQKSHYTIKEYTERIGESDMAYIYFPCSSTYKSASDKAIVREEDSKAVKPDDIIMVSGYPKSQPKLTISLGRLLSKNIEFDNAGYSLNYTNHTASGMSGGGIFTLQGRMLGIHGQASSDIRASRLNKTLQKSGVSIGIAIFKAKPRKWEVWEETPKHEARNLISYLEKELKTRTSKEILIKLGNLYSDIEYFSKADYYYTAALEFKAEMADWEYETVLTMRAITRMNQNMMSEARDELRKIIALQESAGKSSVDSMMLLIRSIPEDIRLSELEDWVERNGEDKLSHQGFLLWSGLYNKLISPENPSNKNRVYSEKAFSYLEKALNLCKEDHNNNACINIDRNNQEDCYGQY
jgi:tetratricopeptide (TPR) repeat protein